MTLFINDFLNTVRENVVLPVNLFVHSKGGQSYHQDQGGEMKIWCACHMRVVSSAAFYACS